MRYKITYPHTTSSSPPRSATAGARWIAVDAARLARPLAHTEVEHIDRWGILPNWGSQFDDFPQAFSGYDLFPRSQFPYGAISVSARRLPIRAKTFLCPAMMPTRWRPAAGLGTNDTALSLTVFRSIWGRASGRPRSPPRGARRTKSPPTASSTGARAPTVPKFHT